MTAPWGGAPALALRRARAQAPLLLAVTATALVALTVLACCGLLLTAGRRDALDAALADAGASGTQVVVRVVPAAAGDGDTAAWAQDAVAVVADRLRPVTATTSAWTESPLLTLPAGGFAYLVDAPDVPAAARLLDGAWPSADAGSGAAGAPRDVAVPAAAAAALGLRPGDVVDLAPSADAPRAADRTPVRVTGVYAATGRGDAGTPVWARDLLGGVGADPEHDRPGTSGRQAAPAYGPFVVAPGTLPAAGTGVGAVSVVLLPELRGAPVGTLRDAARAAGGARPALEDALGDRADRVVVRTSLPATVATAATQHEVTGAAVLTAGLVVATLAGAALLLAGRLLATRRAAERSLLVDRGAAPGQLLALATAEAAALVVVAGALAVPAALLAYRGLTAVPLLAAAGVRAADGVPPALVATVVAGGAALLAALAAPATRPAGGRRGAAGTGRRLARSGGDLLLLALAVLAVLRLRAVGAGAGGDAVRVLAPALALAAAAVVVLRTVPVLGRLAERAARSSRRFVLPLAALDVARRPRAATALLLLVLAAAGASFATSWAATWSRSQTDQAQASVPAAVVARDLPRSPSAQGASARAAARGDAEPVTDRVTGLGTLVVGGGDGPAPRLVAVDTRDARLDGRLPAGTTWPGLTSGLAPADDELAAAVPVRWQDDGLGLRVSGTASGSVPLAVTATVVVDDGEGVRTPVSAGPVPLDGVEHVVHAASPGGAGAGGGPGGAGAAGAAGAAGLAALAPDARVLAVVVELAPAVPVGEGEGGLAAVDLAVHWDAPDRAATDATPAGSWSAAPTAASAGAETVTQTAVTAEADGVRATARVAVSRAAYAPTVVVLGSFPRTPELPVVVDRGLAGDAALGTGDRLDVLVGDTVLPARVAAVAPYVPGAVGGPAVLADLRTLSRVALGQGETTALVDAWWLPAGADVEALRADGAQVAVRADTAAELRGGPLRVGLLAALGLLVVAALALALVGAALHAAETADDRGPEVARLLALGASARAVAGTHVVQHVVVDVLAVATGTTAGAVVAGALAPALTVAPDGGRPVPDALVVWPWPAVAAVAAVLLAGSAAVVLPVVRRLVRRASAAHLRLGDAE